MLTLPIFLALLAGLANGSFLAPIKKNMKNVSSIWLAFAFLTYFLFSTIVLIIAIICHKYRLPPTATIIILLTGIFYGFGLYLLTISIKHIGIGIPLALNISLGILSGSFFSVLVSGKFGGLFNSHFFVAYCMIFLAIILYAIALSCRDKNTVALWKKGFIYALVGSLFCATQGACLSFYSDMLKSLNQGYLSQLIPWALIFMSCSVIFMLSHHRQYKLSSNVEKINLKKVIIAASTMTALQVISILIYTFANIKTEQYSQLYLWGIFMVCIVLSSTICSYLKKEWNLLNVRANIYNAIAILMLIASVIILALGS